MDRSEATIARETDQPREQPCPWWREHNDAEIDIAVPTLPEIPSPVVSASTRTKARPPDQRPAPFSLDVAEKVPPTDKPGGAHDRLDMHDGRTGIPLDSGRKTGLVDALRQQRGDLPAGFTPVNQAYVDAHAAAYLRLHPEIPDATLYVNRQPCPAPGAAPTTCPRCSPSTPR
jgi:hypothetical protein